MLIILGNCTFYSGNMGMDTVVSKRATFVDKIRESEFNREKKSKTFSINFWTIGQRCTQCQTNKYNMIKKDYFFKNISQPFREYFF